MTDGTSSCTSVQSRLGNYYFGSPGTPLQVKLCPVEFLSLASLGVVCKSVPLDLTWGQVTLALNAPTPLNLIGTRLHAGSKDLFLDHAVRQSRAPAFATIGTLGREPGGRDDDSDDSDEEMMPLQTPQFVQQAIDNNQEAAVLSTLSFDENQDDAGTQGGAPRQGWASGLVNGVVANLSAVLFSPAVESLTPAPPTPSGMLFSPAVESPAQAPAPPAPTPSSIAVPDLALKRSSAVDTGENNDGGF